MKKKCEQNNENIYFKVNARYIQEIEELLSKENRNNSDVDFVNFDDKTIKYLDFVEAYRLTRYQFSRYSDIHKSSV